MIPREYGSCENSQMYLMSVQGDHLAWESGKPGIVREFQLTWKYLGFFSKVRENLKSFNSIFFHQKKNMNTDVRKRFVYIRGRFQRFSHSDKIRIFLC